MKTSLKVITFHFVLFIKTFCSAYIKPPCLLILCNLQIIFWTEREKRQRKAVQSNPTLNRNILRSKIIHLVTTL